MPSKIKRNDIDFPYAIRSFMGYLEGTHKSAHTIKNYRLDILSFQAFISQKYAHRKIRLDQVSRADLESFGTFLKGKGLKTNTRRRKILTVTQFVNYLSKRNKLAPEMGQKLAAPHKIERIPYTVSTQQLVSAIKNLTTSSLIEFRNKVLLWTLAETGCLVSEITDIRFDQWSQISPALAQLKIMGKFSRSVPVSMELYQAVHELKKVSKNPQWIFFGFNKFGPLSSRISSRGVEMLVKSYASRLGYPELTPRIFRHSAILQWFGAGISQEEIQARLGLKTTYAFRSYGLLLKSSSKTTSKAETSPLES